MDTMRAPEVKIALVVDDDERTCKRLRLYLEADGYAVLEAADAESALDVLRSSATPVIVLFNVVLHNNVMTGTDSVRLLGAVAREPDLATRHRYLLLTPSPENVSAALGRLLAQLSIPIVATPIDAVALYGILQRTTYRLAAASA